MKIRYKKDQNKAKPLAKIYTNSEHNIDINKVDKDAIKIIKKLTDSGFNAYIVGGAVRDLLLGINPKDFDVVTSASPAQVRRLFYNSRIIGKRFLLVHVAFGHKIIEVSTFRGKESNNIFGTIEEDSKRRDFSLNSLYYNPFEQTILDFTNGYNDIKKKIIKSLIPLRFTFKEDPVRMIRAVKYSVTTGFKIPLKLKLTIKFFSSELQNVSHSRITDEIIKILNSGQSSEIIKQLYNFHLLQFMLPFLSFISDKNSMLSNLKELDSKKASGISLSDGISALIKSSLYINPNLNEPQEIKSDLFRQAKVLLNPITPPNFDIETACSNFMKDNGIINSEIPKKKVPKIQKKNFYFKRRKQRKKNIL